jgi:Type II secretory pathway, ATPase PulE/Tfp pilus assembly pathway, ATPase PilB
MLGLEAGDTIKAFVGKGCLSCRNAGFKGRIGIYELLLVDAEISELVLEQAPGYKIREKARDNGMRTLLEDGIIKIERGDTTISEVYETLGTTKIII